MISHSKRLLLLLAGMIAFTLLVSVFIDTAPDQRTEVAIGAIFPLSGDSAYWGINPKYGIEMALKDLKPGSENSFRIIYEDDHCDPKAAVSAYQKLTKVDKVRIIFGPSCSSATLAVAPLAEKDGVILVAFSEADSISQAGDNIFRVWVPNGRQGEKLARYIKEGSQLGRVGILSVQNAFGTDIVEAFVNEYQKLGGTIVAQEDYEPSSRDFRSALLRIKARKPDALFFASYIADGAILMRQAKALDVAPHYFAGSTIHSPEFFKAVENEADGLIFTDLVDSSDYAFQKRFSEFSSVPWPGMQSGAPLFYDMLRFIDTLPVERVQDNSLLRASLYSLENYKGVSGDISFDGNGDFVREHNLFRVSGSSAKILPE